MIDEYIRKLGIDISKFPEYLKKINAQGFDIYKLEKDFLLTIILDQLYKNVPELIFKGGICLNKCYLDYFRLSEDLDFNIIFTGNRGGRKQQIINLQDKLYPLFENMGFIIIESIKRDEHRFFSFSISYKSKISSSIDEKILIDIKFIDKLLVNPKKNKINSLFINYITEEIVFDDIEVNCMSFDEIVSEKLRASLTRKHPAIRDFFDIWYIKNKTEFDFSTNTFKKLVDYKLKEANYDYSIDGSYENLQNQIKTDLNPVLNKNYDFNLKEIYEFLLKFKK